MRAAAALFIATLAVAAADAAEVTTEAPPSTACAAHAAPPTMIKTAAAKGRMPVRGMSHFAAIYGRSLTSPDEPTADAGDRTAALARDDESRS